MRFHVVVLTIVLAAAIGFSSPAYSQILFSDDFSGGLSAWTLENPSYWSIVNGWLDVDMPTAPNVFAKALAGDASWTDYRLEYDVVGMVESSKISYFRYHDETKGYFLNVRGYVAGEGDPGAIRLFKLNGNEQWDWGSWTLQKQVPFITPLGTVFHVKIQLIGPEIVVYVDGVEKLRYVDTVAPVFSGKIGFAGFTGADYGNHVRWDNVVVSGLGAVPVESRTWGAIKSLYK